MSIGISPTAYQGQKVATEFSTSNSQPPQQGLPEEQNRQQSITSSALLFNTGTQREINFDPPQNCSSTPLNSNTNQDGSMNLLQLLSTLLMGLLRMLMGNAQQSASKPAESAPQQQNSTPNNNGLGTQLADSNHTDRDTAKPTGTPGQTETSSSSRQDDSLQKTTTDAPSASSGSTASSVPNATGGVVVLDHTIKVGPGETFDGHNQVFTASSKLGDGGQREDQLPLFELAEGATLKNVILGDNEADGIHVLAANEKPVTIENLHATNVGEDLLTVKPEGGAEVTHVNILNSSAAKANDKIFQLNANAELKIDGFKADDFGTFVRTNGGQQFNKMTLDLDNIQASHGKFSFVKSDSENLNLHTSNISLEDVQHAYDKTKASTRHSEQ